MPVLFRFLPVSFYFQKDTLAYGFNGTPEQFDLVEDCLLEEADLVPDPGDRLHTLSEEVVLVRQMFWDVLDEVEKVVFKAVSVMETEVAADLKSFGKVEVGVGFQLVAEVAAGLPKLVHSTVNNLASEQIRYCYGII